MDCVAFSVLAYSGLGALAVCLEVRFGPQKCSYRSLAPKMLKIALLGTLFALVFDGLQNLVFWGAARTPNLGPMRRTLLEEMGSFSCGWNSKTDLPCTLCLKWISHVLLGLNLKQWGKSCAV